MMGYERMICLSTNPFWRILVLCIRSMSIVVIGLSLLFSDKDCVVCCIMFIDLLGDD
jgi:hypothetical protein